MTSEEVDSLVIQRTQQKLGKYIQRPHLTDKLLKRPPFRFIHDIITAVINQYGIFENVFTKQELLSENIKEKEDKIAFLQKFISHLSSELGENLNIKPSKIVAGIEAEKTNDLLQALALVLENKQNSNTQSKSNNSESKNNSNLHSTKPVKNVIKKSSLPSNMSKGNSVYKTTTKADAVSKQAAVNKTKDIAKIGANKSNQGSSLKPSLAGMPSKKTSKLDEAKKEPAASAMKSDIVTKQTKPIPSVSAKPNHSSRISKDNIGTLRSVEPLENPHKNQTVIVDEEIADTIIPLDRTSNVDDEPIKDTSALRADDEDNPQITSDIPSIDSGITIEQPVDTLNMQQTKSAAIRDLQDEGFDKEDSTETQELPGALSTTIAQLSPPQSNILNAFEKPIPDRSTNLNLPLKRPASGQRPKSSRRPPSRNSRDRLSVIQQESRPITSQVPRVIIEGNPMSDDEEDRIVQAAVFDQATADLSQVGADELIGGAQGKLVEQILSAQREWDPLIDMDPGNRDNSSSSVQVQHLKNMIQEMTQTALPLGQLIPLIHEDMDTVHQEWQFWKREADLLEEEYQREKTYVDAVVEKLRAELEQLDRAVFEYQIKLNTAKAAAIKTEKDVSLVISNFAKKR
ncbi:TRAF3-interacting protein 1-like [Daphnia carinata]|uniref:TRAF3-interacting protein 1-like n=1 Tax=Daphnia carinata TaxID=120202 RepID=UPI00257A9DCD|nr:TRAF3-interacting protein 1-like [Daphnia carinata]